MPRQTTPRTTLENLRNEAKRWLRALRAGKPEALARLRDALDHPPDRPTLRDVQHALAREHGMPGWTALKRRVAGDGALRFYEAVAEALVTAYRTADPAAMRVVWDYFGHGRTPDGMRRYVRLDLGKTEQTGPGEVDDLTLAEARTLVARAQGFERWEALAAFASTIEPEAPAFIPKAVGLYSGAEPPDPEAALRTRDWNQALALVRDRQCTGLYAAGQMTHRRLEQLSALESITSLHLEGSRALTDEGLRHLARLPRLRYLNLMGCGITDRGLEVLRRLPNLEELVLAWTAVTDAGVAHLSACDRLRRVDLTSTASGDGAVRALAGKAHLHEFRSGDALTDEALHLLRELPVFRRWPHDVDVAKLGVEERPNLLALHGSLTDAGIARLSELEGLAALDLDDRRLGLTGAALAPLVDLPRLVWLGFDATDESMPRIAALPHLRFLFCQDTTAGDDGFEALSRSRSIEHIWGRRCYNLRRRGFVALAGMPALRYLSVSCRNVDDEGLSALPSFPALRELMPMDVPDEGYRHVARCDRLRSLVLMYCRETTDEATKHVARLPALQKYFASYTRITDRTPELLSGVESLEEVTFDSCAGLTNTGIGALARLPRLRELRVGGMPGVTREVKALFRTGVRVRYQP